MTPTQWINQWLERTEQPEITHFEHQLQKLQHYPSYEEYQRRKATHKDDRR